ncbi:MAG: NUDIX hydrolase [Patescibacteria group bacterium]
MERAAFKPESGVSYSAGVAFIFLKNKIPHLLLMLQRAGEKNLQKSGGFFVEERAWKMPMGHFNIRIDTSLTDTAQREFEEETGCALPKGVLDAKLSISIRIPSDRPDAEFHEDTFFLVVTDKEPKPLKDVARDKVIEKTKWFPLSKLPGGDDAASEGAGMAFGHRKKLARLLLACENKKTKDGIEIRKLLTSLTGK